MKFKDITKRNFNPKDWLSRTNQVSLYVPAFAVDVNDLSDDVSQLYSNFKSATGTCTAVSGTTGSFTVTDSDVVTGTKLVMTVTDVESAASGYPYVASAKPQDGTIIVTVGNAIRDVALNVANMEVTYFINKELS